MTYTLKIYSGYLDEYPTVQTFNDMYEVQDALDSAMQAQGIELDDLEAIEQFTQFIQLTEGDN